MTIFNIPGKTPNSTAPITFISTACQIATEHARINLPSGTDANIVLAPGSDDGVIPVTISGLNLNVNTSGLSVAQYDYEVVALAVSGSCENTRAGVLRTTIDSGATAVFEIDGTTPANLADICASTTVQDECIITTECTS